MKLTPAQLGVVLICGNRPPMLRRENDSIDAVIRDGRDFLRKISRQDFGYDLQAWHDYLKESRVGGYTYARTIVLPKCMASALARPEWQAAVERLREKD